MDILNQRIKERRLAQGLTLAQVAEKLGVKEATVQRYESGDIKNIKHETIYKLSKNVYLWHDKKAKKIHNHWFLVRVK